MKKKIRSLLYFLNLFFIVVVSLNIVILILTKGYDFSLGSLRISSHDFGKLFVIQVILVILLKIIFNKKTKSRENNRELPLTQSIFPSKRFIIFLLLSVLFISISAYYKTSSGYFLSDDFEFLNLFKKNPTLNTEILFNYFKQFGLFRPLSIFSLYTDHLIWRLNPFGFHLTNLIFHVLNSLLVFMIIFLLFKDKYSSMLSAVLFSIFPIHMEASVWISGRFDLCCTSFYLLAIVLFLYFTQDKRKHSFIYIMSLLSFVFALLSKEMAITLPLVIILLDLFFADRSKTSGLKDRIKMHLPFWLILLSYFTVRIAFLGNMGGYSNKGGEMFFLQGNFLYDLKALILRPFSPLFVPLNKAVIPDHAIIKDIICIILALLIFLIPFRKKLNFKQLFSGLVFILIAVLPVFKILYISNTLEGARFLYLPSIGACLILSGLFKINNFRKAGINKILNIFTPCLLIFFFWFVFTKNSIPWIKASETSKNISYQAKKEIKKIPKNSTVFVLNLPDNYKGAYIFRNGFDASMELSGNSDKRIIIDINKININRLNKYSSYLILEWKQNKFKFSRVSFSTLKNLIDKKIQTSIIF